VTSECSIIYSHGAGFMTVHLQLCPFHVRQLALSTFTYETFHVCSVEPTVFNLLHFTRSLVLTGLMECSHKYLYSFDHVRHSFPECSADKKRNSLECRKYTLIIFP
jgi:hypothetical protein